MLSPSLRPAAAARWMPAMGAPLDGKQQLRYRTNKAGTANSLRHSADDSSPVKAAALARCSSNRWSARWHCPGARDFLFRLGNARNRAHMHRKKPGLKATRTLMRKPCQSKGERVAKLRAPAVGSTAQPSARCCLAWRSWTKLARNRGICTGLVASPRSQTTASPQQHASGHICRKAHGKPLRPQHHICSKPWAGCSWQRALFPVASGRQSAGEPVKTSNRSQRAT